MKIFRYQTDPGKYASLSSVGEPFSEYRKFTSKSMREFNCAVRLIPTNDSMPIPNLFILSHHIPVLDDTALSVFSPFLPSDVECISIDCESLKLSALNVLHRIQALRKEDSTLSFDSGGLVREIEDGVFDASRIGDVGLFTIKEMNSIFYTEKLLDEVHRHNLKGLRVEPIGVAK